MIHNPKILQVHCTQPLILDCVVRDAHHRDIVHVDGSGVYLGVACLCHAEPHAGPVLGVIEVDAKS